MSAQKVYLALKRTAAQDAGLLGKIGAWAIKARLVSQYCHGGIVVGDVLMHANAAKGLHATREFDPTQWHLYPADVSADIVLQRFAELGEIDYDWFSLLAFVGLRASDSKRMYCFEWCYFALTGINPSLRVTPEMLIDLACQMPPHLCADNPSATHL